MAVPQAIGASVVDHEPPLSEALVPSMAQAGGGLFFDIEVAWARARRRWLRRLRPGYVRHMESVRQGECKDCPHDVIDARDLKLVRNVCGYRFAPADDRFAWRERIPLARYGLAEALFASLFCAPLFALVVWLAVGNLLWWPLVGGLGWLWFQMVWFFRDPTRVPPADPDAMLSPVDGVVTDIDEVVAPGFPGDRAARISIYLSVWNVHLSRVPRSGRVTQMRYFKGAFLNARHPDCVRRNEQIWLDYVEPNGRMIRVKAFSGALARRLVSHVCIGEDIVAGQRFGLVKYGSRADILVPLGENMTWTVKVGDVVAGATTVVARFGTAPL